MTFPPSRPGVGRPARAAIALLTIALAACAAGGSRATEGGGNGSPAISTLTPSPSPTAPETGAGEGSLVPGSDPAVLPGPILIADEGNNRAVLIDPTGRVLWQFPRPGDLPAGETFLVPDDTFFSADHKTIVATEEENAVVSLVDIASRTITYRYGQPAMPGSGPNRLANPDDALMLPDGSILTADIKNCRILRVAADTHVAARIYGTTGVCQHHPPTMFGSPNGAFPLRDGNLLVTEINGDWVDEMTLGGSVLWAVHPPQVGYPSDTNEVAAGKYLTVDYSAPGQILIFDRNGHTLWRYRPTGAAALDHPSLALPLPNGDVLATDDHHDRVIVVDPHTDRVVWQYGHTGVPGAGPGYLNGPDGADLSGSASLLTQFAPALAAAVAKAPLPRRGNSPD